MMYKLYNKGLHNVSILHSNETCAIITLVGLERTIHIIIESSKLTNL